MCIKICDRRRLKREMRKNKFYIKNSFKNNSNVMVGTTIKYTNGGPFMAHATYISKDVMGILDCIMIPSRDIFSSENKMCIIHEIEDSKFINHMNHYIFFKDMSSKTKFLLIENK